jgi:hypothetical protein
MSEGIDMPAFEDVRADFMTDGSVRLVEFEGAPSSEMWRAVIELFTTSGLGYEYLESGRSAGPTPFPGYDEAIRRCQTSDKPHLCAMHVWLGAAISAVVNFRRDGSLLTSVNPAQINSQSSLDAIAEVITSLGKMLRRDVVLAHEYSLTRDHVATGAILRYSAVSRTVAYVGNRV